jgi:hypothetical protein
LSDDRILARLLEFNLACAAEEAKAAKPPKKPQRGKQADEMI